jgi:hypothetical protein
MEVVVLMIGCLIFLILGCVVKVLASILQVLDLNQA